MADVAQPGHGSVRALEPPVLPSASAVVQPPPPSRHQLSPLSGDQLRAIVGVIPGIVWTAAPDGVGDWANDYWYEFTGTDHTASIIDTFYHILHPNDQDRTAATWAEARRNGSAYEFELRLRNRHGRYHWFLVRCTPVGDEAGVLTRWIGIATDITERIHAEQRLATRAATSRVLAQAATLEEAAPMLAAAICETTGWDESALWLVPDAEGGALRLAGLWHASRGEVSAFEAATRAAVFHRGAGLPGRVWASGEPEWISDVATELNFPRRMPAQASGLVSGTAFPLRQGEQVWGVLEFFSRDKRPRDDAFLDLLSDLSTQVGEFAQRKRAEAALRASEAQLRASEEAERAARERTERLQELTASLSAGATERQLADAVLRQGMLALGAVAGGVSVVTEDGSAQRLLAVSGPGIDPDRLQSWSTFPIDGPFPVNDVVRLGQLMELASFDEYRLRYPELSEHMMAAGYEAYLAAPLVIGGQPAGAVNFNFSDRRKFAPEDLELVRTMAALASQALERARLFEAEQAARLAAERERAFATEANWAKSQFLATMSHELRTPLNAIQGHAQLIEMEVHGPIAPPQREALGRIQSAQRHLLSLINDILNYAKLEAGRVEYELATLSVADVFAEVLPLVEPLMAAKGLALDVSLPHGGSGSDRGPLVWADREKLAQILLNLLSNAAKFTPPLQRDGAQGRVTVELVALAESPELVHVTVSDTGVGIPPDKLEAIFDPFVQVHRSFTRATEGVGLGLAISRGLAIGMEGNLLVASEPGHGSTFTIVLRRAPGPAIGVRVE